MLSKMTTVITAKSFVLAKFSIRFKGFHMCCVVTRKFDINAIFGRDVNF